MPLQPTKDILQDAFAKRYGVGAFNIFNDLTIQAVLDAATQQRAPVLIQTSVKTVRAAGARVLFSMVDQMSRSASVPVGLHLDHCPDRGVITECLAEGWGSVLFDGSALPLDENRRQTTAVVAEARRVGASVEGEIETITGVEDGIGSHEESANYDLDLVVDFIEHTGVDFFAPAVGTAHGVYKVAPRLDPSRVSRIVERSPVPQVLHGGTGLSSQQFADLVGRGCAKVNISTGLKVSYMQANLAYLRGAEAEHHWDPPALFNAVKEELVATIAEYIKQFASSGRA